MLILLDSIDIFLDKIELVYNHRQYSLFISCGVYSTSKVLTQKEIVRIEQLFNINIRSLKNINLLRAPIECSMAFNGTPISITSKYGGHLFIDFSTCEFDDHTFMEFYELLKQNKTSALY